LLRRIHRWEKFHVINIRIFDISDDSTSDLHQSFADLVEDNPEKLKEFVPACGENTVVLAWLC
jgi:hypothetical protein